MNWWAIVAAFGWGWFISLRVNQRRLMTPERQAWQNFTNNGMVLPENHDNGTVSGNPETDSKTSLSGLTDTL